MEYPDMLFNSTHANPMFFGNANPIVKKIIDETNQETEPERTNIRNNIGCCWIVCVILLTLTCIGFFCVICMVVSKAKTAQENLDRFKQKMDNILKKHNDELLQHGFYGITGIYRVQVSRKSSRTEYFFEFTRGNGPINNVPMNNAPMYSGVQGNHNNMQNVELQVHGQY
jgi:hypothetical protein